MAKERLDLTEAPSISQYTKWVDKNGVLPTQDPIYNHSAGHPLQPSLDQPLSAARDIASTAFQEQAWDSLPQDVRDKLRSCSKYSVYSPTNPITEEAVPEEQLIETLSWLLGETALKEPKYPDRPDIPETVELGYN